MVTAAALAAQPSVAETVNEFTGEVNDSWNIRGNWELGVPDNSHRAWIPSAKSCKVYNGDNPAVADSIDVDGTLAVDEEQTLTIDTDSRIDGTLTLESYGDYGAKLPLTASLTITGYGGKIQMGSHCEIDESSGGPYVLTLESDCLETLEAGCGLTLIGAGEINTGLTNNGFVIGSVWCEGAGQPPPCALSLNQTPVSGTGEWQAQDGGWLLANVLVTGSATWRISQGDSDADGLSLIEINACCYDLSGEVILKNGTFKVNEDFCTEGDLTLASTDNGYETTDPAIDVACGAVARFSVMGDVCSCP